MHGTHQPSVAIVGSGPSGCYAAQFIRKRWRSAAISVFDALPVPYGLIRYGIAADHQGTKAVTAQFDRLFEREGVLFAGNVSIDRDIDFESLADAFDIVILASGLQDDRRLDVPHDPRARLVGAGAVLRALNGCPSSSIDIKKHAPLGKRLVVVGTGNVALDVARLLSKTKDDLLGSDLDNAVLAELRPSPLHSIDIIGRSPLHRAKFDVAMLRELCALSNVQIFAEGIADADAGSSLDVLKEAMQTSAASARAPRQRITFHFGLTPRSVTESGGVTTLHTSTVDGIPSRSFDADSIVTAVGFVPGESLGIPMPKETWHGANVFRVGWLRRGPIGTVAENRRCAKEVTDAIFALAENGQLSFGKPGFDAVRPLIASRVIGFEGWRRIDAYELASASPARCRQKVTDVDQMISIATRDEQPLSVPSPCTTDQRVHEAAGQG